MRSHTVYLVREDQLADALLGNWQQWSAAGLIHSISVMDAARVPDHERSSEMFHHLVVGGEISPEADFFSWLATNYVSLLRIVAVHVDGTQEQCREFSDQVDRFQHYMRAWVGAEQRTVSLACYLSSPTDQGFDLDIVSPAWGAHMVINPATQAMPGAASAPLAARTAQGPDQVYAASAASTLILLGGAWINLDEGPFDEYHPGSVAAMMHVVRSYLRTVDFPDPTSELSELALQPLVERGRPVWPLVSGTDGVTSADPPSAFVQRAADEFLEVHERYLNAVIPPPAQPRPVATIGFWNAVKMFFGFLWAAIRRAPADFATGTVTRLSEKASKVATGAMFGPNSEFDVVVGRPGRRPVSRHDQVDSTIERIVRSIDPTMDYLPPAAEVVWRDFLYTGLALMDGSDLPGGISKPQIGDGRAIVQDPSTIAVAPNYPPMAVPPDLLGEAQAVPVVLQPSDPRQTYITVERLRAERERLGGTGGSVQSEPDGDATHDLPAEADEPDSVAPIDGSEPDDESPSLVQRIDTKLADIGEWIENTNRPLTWSVAEHIGSQLDQVEHELARLAMILSQPVPDEPDRELRSAPRVLKWFTAGALGAVLAWLVYRYIDLPRDYQLPSVWAWRIGIAFVVLGVIVWRVGSFVRRSENAAPDRTGPESEGSVKRAGLGGIRGLALCIFGAVATWFVYRYVRLPFDFRLPGRWAWLIAVSSVLFCVAKGVRIFMKENAQRFRDIHSYDSEIHRKNEATEAFLRVAVEEMRLASLYWQVQEWTKVISGLVHNPFGQRPAEPEVGEPLVLDSAPLSVRTATATTEKDRLEILVNSVRRSVFTRGWLTEAARASIVAAAENLQLRMALPSTPDPFGDRWRRSSGALQHLVAGVEVGEHGRIIRMSQSNSIQEQVLGTPLSSLINSVKVNGEVDYPDVTAPPNADPATGLFDEILAADRVDRIQFQPSMWTNRGVGVTGDPRISETIIAATPGMEVGDGGYRRRVLSRPMVHDGRLLLAAARIDISEPCEPHDLAIFHRQQVPPIPPVEPGPGDPDEYD